MDRKKMEKQKTDGRKMGRGDKWREAAGRKMEQHTEGQNEGEEIESGGMRSERKDPIMCMSGCIMASCHPAKANKHSRSLNSENIEQHHFLWWWPAFYVQSAADWCFVYSCVLTDWLVLKKLSSV